MYHVILECLSWKRAISHAPYEFVVRILVPRGFDVLSLEQVIDETASGNGQWHAVRDAIGTSLRREGQ